MINGIYLKEPFRLKDKSDGDILKEVNISDTSCSSEDRVISESYNMIKRTFIDDNYFCESYSLSSLDGYCATISIYNLIQKALPGFLKTVDWGNNSFILVWPKFKDYEDDSRYKKALDEITRFTAWCIKNQDTYLEIGVNISDVIKNYFDFCINYPNKK